MLDIIISSKDDMAGAKKVYRKNKKNEGTYIYLDEPYWYAAAKMGRHRMKCIGKFGLMERMSTMKPIRQALKKTGPSWSQRQYSLERG